MVRTDSTSARFLKHLRRGKTFCSGPALAAQLGVSRSTILKLTEGLRDLGYGIVSHPKKGYHLVDEPDSLQPEKVLPHLRTKWLGKPYRYVEKVGSTNDYLLELGKEGTPHGSVVVAGEQLAGRGRLSRRWISHPHRGVYVSILLRDPMPCKDAPKVTSVASLSLVKVLRTRHNLFASIKWPNDVLIRGKKVAGILTEMQSDEDIIRFLVVGIGINVNQNASHMKTPFRYPATSLSIELKGPLRRGALLVDLLEEFENEYDQLRSRGFAAILPELEQASSILGRMVQIESGQEEVRGKAIALTVDGALRIAVKSGREKVIWVGDVTQIREIT